MVLLKRRQKSLIQLRVIFGLFTRYGRHKYNGYVVLYILLDHMGESSMSEDIVVVHEWDADCAWNVCV